MTFTTMIWVGFLLMVALFLTLDLGVFHRRAKVESLFESLGWSALWVSLALLFNVGVYFLYEYNPSGWDMDTARLTGKEAALQFLTGYLVEKSLSIDNIFVIAMVFATFRIPAEEQHRVLFWGILGAIVVRGLMIFAGIALIERFAWLTYLLGLVLIWSAAKMLVIRHDNVDIANGTVIRTLRRFVPITDQLSPGRFFVVIDGVRTATPLFVALVLVEFTDLMFAIDSIPAIFAITRDPFLVFTSNIFAILGLRSLYFVLAGLMDKFRYLKMSLVFLLAYIGVKMLLMHHYPIAPMVSLAIIGGILAVGLLASTTAGRDAIALLSPLQGEMEKLALVSYRQACRGLVLLLGASVLVIGIAMITLPGPTLLVVSLGILVLAVEFAWAGRWLKRFRESIAEGSNF